MVSQSENRDNLILKQVFLMLLGGVMD
uniref:Uncharacterized protein n=1 Tax=Anguilla anguilla TaxID=7936 RepID=A0A0E9UZ76_ANGAN